MLGKNADVLSSPHQSADHHHTCKPICPPLAFALCNVHRDHGPTNFICTGSCSLYGICLTSAISSSSSNTAPSISLVTTAAAPATTSIKQGWSYTACASGQQPAAGQECELGATAKDAQSGDLTSTVLVCAPSACTTAACIASGYFLLHACQTCYSTASHSILLQCTWYSAEAVEHGKCGSSILHHSCNGSVVPVSADPAYNLPYSSIWRTSNKLAEMSCHTFPTSCSALCIHYSDKVKLPCAGHQFHNVGLTPCALDTAAAAIGSKFTITFTAYDNSLPPMQDTVTRTLLVVSPCSSGVLHMSIPQLPFTCQLLCLVVYWTDSPN